LRLTLLAARFAIASRPELQTLTGRDDFTQAEANLIARTVAMMRPI
jgi:hypothetical protein